MLCDFMCQPKCATLHVKRIISLTFFEWTQRQHGPCSFGVAVLLTKILQGREGRDLFDHNNKDLPHSLQQQL